MAAHMASTDRRRRRRAPLIALGVGLLAVVIVETSRDAPDRTADRPATSVPTVLGATVTKPPAPRAEAATPATFELPDATTASTRRSTRPTASASTSTTGPAEVIDPVTVENTTTSTTEPEPATTTTESPTTSAG